MIRNEEGSFKEYFVPLTTLKIIHFIIIIGLIVFSTMLFNQFVWDDITYIIYNDQLYNLNLINLFGENLFNVGSQYRPIPAVYFSLLYSMFHEFAFFYHFAQLSIHIVNTIILFFLFKSFFSKNLSFILVIIFLIHPIQVESVSYIASTGNPLFFLFGIIALYLSKKESISNKRASVIFMLLLLSFLTKETGFLFLVIIFCYRFLFIERKITNKKNMSFYLFGVITVVAYFLIRFGMAGIYLEGNALPPPIARLSFIERITNIPEVIFYYIKTFFLPIHLIIDQQWTVQNNSATNLVFSILIDIVFFLFIARIGIFIYKKSSRLFKVYLFFSSWFLIGLGMHSQIVPLDMTVADRWFYFPMVGLLGIIGVCFNLFSKFLANHYIKLIGVGIIITILSLLSARTMIRNTNWYNGITLYPHDIALANNDDLQNNLGNEYLRRNNYDEAIKHFKLSISLYPTVNNLYNLALAYEKKGDYKSAKQAYLHVLTLKTTSSIPPKLYLLTHEKIGYIMLFTDNNENANKFIKSALQKYPASGPLWADLAVNEYRMKHYQAALNAAEKAKTYEPTETTFKLYQQMLSNTKQ